MPDIPGDGAMFLSAPDSWVRVQLNTSQRLPDVASMQPRALDMGEMRAVGFEQVMLHERGLEMVCVGLDRLREKDFRATNNLEGGDWEFIQYIPCA